MNSERVARALGSRLDGCIIITLTTEQLSKEIRVSARATADLCSVCRIFALGFERGLLPELFQHILGVAERREPLHFHSVADRSGRLGLPRGRKFLGCRRGRLGCRSDRLGVELRPFDAKIGHRRKRSVRVELRLGERRRLLGCRNDLRESWSRKEHANTHRAKQPRGSSLSSPPYHQGSSLTDAS